MRNVKKSILIVLLFNHLLLGCDNRIFRKGDCGREEEHCLFIGEPGHGYYEIVKTLHEASLAGDLALVQKIVDSGTSLQLTTPANQTALHYVALAEKPNIDLALWLLRQGILINVIDSQGNTALSLAVERGHFGLVIVLIQAGALLDFSHDKGWSLLHLAAFHGHRVLVKYLVEEVKISPLTFDKQGNTALVLALGNNHEAIVFYLKGWTIRNLHAHTPVLKEEIKQRFGKQLGMSLNGLCEHIGVNPAFISIDNLIDNSVKNIQAIVEGEEGTYVTPSNQLEEEDPEVKLQVSQILEGLGKELQRYAVDLPEKSRKELENVSVENLRPQLTTFVKQIKKDKEELTHFSQDLAKQTQEIIDQVNANTKSFEQQLENLKQQEIIEQAQKNEKKETQKLYGLSTRNIAVPCMKHYFIPKDRCSNMKEIKKYMEFIQKNIAQNPTGTSLTLEQQQDMKSLLEEIYQEEEELRISYRELKNYAEHRGGDQVFLEQAKKKRILMEFIREAMTEDPINTPLTDEQQEDLQVLLVQIYEDGEELIQSYKDIKNYVEYRGRYEKFLKRAEQKEILEEGAIQVEAACINGKLENTQVAKQLLEELQSLKEEAYKILKNNKEDISNYIVANEYEANFGNDYSHQELVAYFNSCGEALHPSFFRRALFEEICIQGQETFGLIMQRLGQPEPVSTQDFMDLLQLVPQLHETILMGNADLNKDEVTLDQQVKYITQVVLRIIIQSTPLPLGKTIQVTSLQGIKKRIHKLTVAIEQKITQPNKTKHTDRECSTCSKVFKRKEDLKQHYDEVHNRVPTPYQGPNRSYGYFQCKCGKKWKSDNSWANRHQICKKCKKKVYPYKQKPLQKKS
jgi:hypothetical protein